MAKRAKATAKQDQPREPADVRSASSPQDAVPTDVFVVDDEEGICKLLTLALQPLGVKTETFHSAEAAVAALERGQPDIVFLDISLKGSDAIDVIRALGAMHYGGVVQLMSGNSALLLDDVRRIGARHGLYMRQPLEKPFRADAIRQAVMSTPFDGQTLTTLSLAPTTRIEISEALDKNWMELWYQPKVDLHRGTLVGVEGVLRCRHPVHGVLDSASFLSSENTEADTTALAEHELITALRDWNELNAAGPGLRTAVNVSISVLGNLHLPALVREHRPKSEKWPGLILELTEEEVVKDLDLVHEIATQLRIWGITLAIADFGEGFSSFARMRELPFSELKLDSGFVGGCADDARNAGICQAIIDLARHFGVVSVAAGLENAADLAAIRDMGCHLGQGPVLAEPMPKAQFLADVRKRARTRKSWF